MEKNLPWSNEKTDLRGPRKGAERPERSRIGDDMAELNQESENRKEMTATNNSQEEEGPSLDNWQT